MNYQYRLFTPAQAPTSKQVDATAEFLREHLDQYGDPVGAIKKAINYAVDPDRGGADPRGVAAQLQSRPDR